MAVALAPMFCFGTYAVTKPDSEGIEVELLEQGRSQVELGNELLMGSLGLGCWLDVSVECDEPDVVQAAVNRFLRRNREYIANLW
jgi:hypothetical protein